MRAGGSIQEGYFFQMHLGRLEKLEGQVSMLLPDNS